MLQQLAAATGARALVILSMLFFLAVFVAVAVRVLRRGSQAYEPLSRLPLDEAAPVLPERHTRRAEEG